MRIMLIDDDPIYCEMIRDVLKMLRGMELHIFHNSESAWEAIDSGLCPVLFLLDYRLHGETGIDILSVLRADIRFKDHPILILTSEREKEIVQYAVKMGATGYLLKPIGHETIYRIKQTMQEWYNNILEDPEVVRRRLGILSRRLYTFIEEFIHQMSEQLYQFSEEPFSDDREALLAFEAGRSMAQTIGAKHFQERLDTLVRAYKLSASEETLTLAFKNATSALQLLEYRWKNKIS